MKAIITFALVLSASTALFAQEQRLISVDANATEILVNFGLVDQLVAVDLTSQRMVGPKALPDLGYHRDLSAEGILATNPTLMIGSNHMGPNASIEAIKSAQVEVITLEAAGSTDELVSNIQFLGKRLNKAESAQALVTQVRQQNQKLMDSHKREKPSMVFLLELSGRGLSQAGVGTTGAALIELLGGVNANSNPGYQSISMEALMEINPDVILIGSRQQGVNAAKELLKSNPLLAYSDAAKNNKVLHVNSGVMVAGVSLGVMKEAVKLSEQVYLAE